MSPVNLINLDLPLGRSPHHLPLALTLVIQLFADLLVETFHRAESIFVSLADVAREGHPRPLFAFAGLYLVGAWAWQVG